MFTLGSVPQTLLPGNAMVGNVLKPKGSTLVEGEWSWREATPAKEEGRKESEMGGSLDPAPVSDTNLSNDLIKSPWNE